jgi:hypothetical protein
MLTWRRGEVVDRGSPAATPSRRTAAAAPGSAVRGSAGVGLGKVTELPFARHGNRPLCSDNTLHRGQLLQHAPRPDKKGFIPEAPSGFTRHLPGARKRYESEVAAADDQFKAALAGWDAAERLRLQKLTGAKTRYDAELATVNASVNAHNRSVDELRARCQGGDPLAVVTYFTHVVAATHYPNGFLKKYASLTRSSLANLLSSWSSLRSRPCLRSKSIDTSRRKTRSWVHHCLPALERRRTPQ